MIPVLIKELRTRMRGWRAPAVLMFDIVWLTLVGRRAGFHQARAKLQVGGADVGRRCAVHGGQPYASKTCLAPVDPGEARSAFGHSPARLQARLE